LANTVLPAPINVILAIMMILSCAKDVAK